MSEPRVYFFEMANGKPRHYAGTLNEFFGLMNERGSVFEGSFVPASWQAWELPGPRHRVHPEWEALGAAYRRQEPRLDALWSPLAPHAKSAGGAS